MDESYFQHMRHALYFSLYLALAAVLCLIHALLPWLFESSGSAIVRRLYEAMVVNRKNPDVLCKATQTGSQQSPIERRSAPG